MAYNLRTQATKNTRTLVLFECPGLKGYSMTPTGFYVVEVLEKDEKRVKIHYVSYSTMHDEWRDVEDIMPP